jgi:hypothetical protein
MEKHVDGMGAGWVQAENLAIESMREPGDRVPVRRFRGVESPNDGVPGEPGTNVEIVGDMELVVVIEKWSAGNGVIERKGCEHEHQAENQSASLWDLKNVGPSRSRIGLLLRRKHGIHRTLARGYSQKIA